MRNFDGQNTQISQDFTASNLPGSKNQCYNIREVVSVELNFEGVVVGVMSLVIIGAFHPLVIWFEYHFTQSIWPVFLIAGLLCLIAALIGLILGYYLTTVQAFTSLAPVNVLFFLVLWLIPTLLISGNVNRY